MSNVEVPAWTLDIGHFALDIESVPRFATIVLAGAPNAGKSTLLNALVGEHLAAVSSKPQTTREPVHGLVTEGDTQLLFVDPPGLLEPHYGLQEGMLLRALEALRDADAVVHLHPVDEGDPPTLEEVLQKYEAAVDLPDELRASPRVAATPVLTVVTKGDVRGTDLAHLVVSAVTKDGLDDLLAWCRAQARPASFRYPPDDIGTQPMRFFAAEYVREAAFEVLEQELPYALAVTVDEFREGDTPVYIRLTLYVERESQKGMVIGKGGRTIKELGARARARIETLLGTRVFLDMWIKVWPKWRRSPGALRQLGFPVPVEREP